MSAGQRVLLRRAVVIDQEEVGPGHASVHFEPDRVVLALGIGFGQPLHRKALRVFLANGCRYEGAATEPVKVSRPGTDRAVDGQLSVTGTVDGRLGVVIGLTTRDACALARTLV